jgi:hypothetical protein
VNPHPPNIKVGIRDIITYGFDDDEVLDGKRAEHGNTIKFVGGLFDLKKSIKPILN